MKKYNQVKTELYNKGFVLQSENYSLFNEDVAAVFNNKELILNLRFTNGTYSCSFNKTKSNTTDLRDKVYAILSGETGQEHQSINVNQAG